MTNAPPREGSEGPDNGFHPKESVKFCRLGNDCLVFDEAAQAVYRLDPLSGALWEALSAGRARREIVKDLAEAVGQNVGEAEGFIAACLAEWKARGLLNGGEGEWADAPAHPVGSMTPRQKVSAGAVYEVGGMRFAVDFPDDETFSAWEALAGHMRSGASSKGDVALSVLPEGAGYRVDRPGDTQTGLEDASAVAVHLKEQVLRIILAGTPGVFALHAAALDHRGAAVLIAGGSGRGKTTLAACLHAGGLPVIADDVALIDPSQPSVSGLAFSFAVKAGAVGVLGPAYGELPAEPGYLRPDGKMVKYLRPRNWSAGAAGIGAVVFPRFTLGRACTIEPCTRADALTALLSEAVNTDQRLSKAGFAALCDLLKDADCLTAEYGDAGEASSRLLNRLDNGAE
ncbi:PqqD family peptide modification chaperone [Rhizobiales bacterium]|uniref:PqqD family peptide modification chaperone n=1 Tax=Hongsoonwoonella zoysiae TaxID=2821844 RepID=UPI0015615A38|nr:PqqD family peptide modification chaperone [Hongsoonwoonella zoysiae]NRG17880.1 PqqD family peptide modification chaperone [Hongsoonwoonella zoysiae]